MDRNIPQATDDERSDTMVLYAAMAAPPYIMWSEYGDFNSGAFLGLAAFIFASLIVTLAIDDKERQEVVVARTIRAGTLMIVVAFFSALMALVRMYV